MAKLISDTERKVINVLIDKDNKPMTKSQIVDEIDKIEPPAEGKRGSYYTIRHVIEVLCKKKVLKRKPEGARDKHQRLQEAYLLSAEMNLDYFRDIYKYRQDMKIGPFFFGIMDKLLKEYSREFDIQFDTGNRNVLHHMGVYFPSVFRALVYMDFPVNKNLFEKYHQGELEKKEFDFLTDKTFRLRLYQAILEDITAQEFEYLEGDKELANIDINFGISLVIDGEKIDFPDISMSMDLEESRVQFGDEEPMDMIYNLRG